MSNIFLNSIHQGLFPIVVKLLIIFLPIILPIIFIVAWWILRYRWITLKYVEAQKSALLEIKLPKEILKSPAAMEIFFSYLSGGGADNYGDAFIDGKTKPWFSCELVSIGGDVKFFIWCSQIKFKSIIESQLYAQYPNIEIYEVEEKDEYTKMIDFDLEKYVMYGLQYKLTEADVYPIKTYIDYGLDKDQKEEYKIDPMNAVIEFFGSMKAGENMWMQILIQKHEKEGWFHGILKREGRDFKEEIKKEIEVIRKKSIPESDDDEEFSSKFPNPTKGQIETISAIERNAGKPASDCMIRSVYIAETSAFNAINIGGIIGILKQYGSKTSNGFKPGFTTDISNAKKDIARILPFLKKSNDQKIVKYKKNLFHAYKLRSFFQEPFKHYKGKPFVMTTEELATLFHFPSGIVAQTPTLKRVPSKKSEAPSNLPI